ncbi:protein disabled-like [Uloborus diversus]|uniref:protein disabled-like n=1 Tax=Uloborus diversus TaxID=327109 RepID=UPI0024095DFB|nr:protein disabled-like [Uloborus diversus]XP_054706143.1 protein disabled-like [Uloborus diversus]
MQDKETVDDAEEALTFKAETPSDRPLEKEHSEGKKESTKEGKFAFKKMKQPKKEKVDKNSPSRFEGEGVIFKAKLIGVESVSGARGDKMCQDAMQRLKLNVRNTGPHKRKINICVSLQGIKIKDEKFGNEIYHHPVSLISFISQDITDARAFGYVFGSLDEPHQFIAIKTEKPAFHVVLALRDLFQTVLNHKQEEIKTAKETKNENGKSAEENDVNGGLGKQVVRTETEPQPPAKVQELTPKDENIYVEVLLMEPLQMKEDAFPVDFKDEQVKTVDDMLEIQDEMIKLQEGINQMDSSIAAFAANGSKPMIPGNDPFDTSFVLGPKRDSFTLPMPTPVPVAAHVSNELSSNQFLTGDKYAVFNALDAVPSVFESSSEPANTNDPAVVVPDLRDLEEEITKKTPPAKPPRQSKSASPDQSVFADLDPLGKDRPYKDKTEFFQDVKNPPKKSSIGEESPYATIVKKSSVSE